VDHFVACVFDADRFVYTYVSDVLVESPFRAERQSLFRACHLHIGVCAGDVRLSCARVEVVMGQA